MFDLTAANIAGKYPGKDGLKMLIHLVFKVFSFLCVVICCENHLKKKKISLMNNTSEFNNCFKINVIILMFLKLIFLNFISGWSRITTLCHLHRRLRKNV